MAMLRQAKEELEGWRGDSRAFSDEDSKLEHKKKWRKQEPNLTSFQKVKILDFGFLRFSKGS